MIQQTTLVLIGVLICNFALAILWSCYYKIAPYFKKLEKFQPFFISFALLFLWAFIFLVYRFSISGDVVSFFIPQGRAALSGLIPNRDFNSSYMPLFSYVMGAVDFAWRDEKALGLFFTLCLCTSSFLFSGIIRRQKNELSAKVILIAIGLLNSVVWVLGVGYQQDECYVLLLIGYAVLASTNKRNFLTGILIGITLLFTKITLVIFWIPFFLISEKKKDYLAGLAISTVPILAIFCLLGFSPTRMLGGESAGIVPPSLITVVRLIPPIYLFFISNPIITYILNLSILGVVCLIVYRLKIHYSFGNLMGLLVTIWLLFLLFSLKALTSYRILVIAFIPFVLETYRQKWKTIPFWFAIYCSLISVHYMFYEDWNKITRVHLDISAVPLLQLPQFIILTIIEVGIVLFEVGWVTLALKSIFSKKLVTNQLLAENGNGT